MTQVPIDHLAPLTHPSLDLYLLGFVVGCSMVAGLFFLRFWRETRDPLFLGFTTFFFVQAGINTVALDLKNPNAASAWVFLLRLVSTFAVLAAILLKNTQNQ